GLSMGGMQTHTTTMANLDKFAYIGLFSGGNIPLAEIKDPAAFKKQVKAVFFGNGQLENSAPSKAAAEELKNAGIHAYFYESPRTAHEFLTWRRCCSSRIRRRWAFDSYRRLVSPVATARLGCGDDTVHPCVKGRARLQ